VEQHSLSEQLKHRAKRDQHSLPKQLGYGAEKDQHSLPKQLRHGAERSQHVSCGEHEMKLLLTNPVVQRTHDGVKPINKEITELIFLFIYLRNFRLLPVYRDDYEDER
jgi:hypothetical protein